MSAALPLHHIMPNVPNRDLPCTWYAVIAGFLNVLVALTIYIIRIDEILLAGSALIAIVSATMLTLFLTRGTSIVSLLGFGALMLQLTLGTSLPFAWVHGVGLGDSVSTLLRSIQATSESYSLALLYSILGSFILSLLACHPGILKAETQIADSLLKCLRLPPQILVVVALCILGFEFGLLASGTIDIRGFSMSTLGDGASHKIPWYSPLLMVAQGMQMPLAALFLARFFREHGSPQRSIMLIMCGLLLLLGLYIAALGERRGFVICSILFLVFLVFFYQSSKVLILILPQLLIMMLILSPVLNIMHAMRYAGREEGNAFQKIFSAASDYFTSASFREKLKTSSEENLSTRPLVLGIVASSMMIQGSDLRILHGSVLCSGVVWSIPRGLYPNKEKWLRDEDLLFEGFHDPIFFYDQADSFALDAWADFGWAGLVIYPLVISVLWFVVLKTMISVHIPMGVFAIFSLWPSYWFSSMAESAVTSFFEIMRTSITFSILIMLAHHIYKKTRLSRSAP